jgi:hypothetical protein
MDEFYTKKRKIEVVATNPERFGKSKEFKNGGVSNGRQFVSLMG